MGQNCCFLGQRRVLLLLLFGTAVQAGGCALLWAFVPPQQAPKGQRNNISVEVISAIEGLWQPRFQRYFRDSLAYYVQLQLGSDRASGLHLAEEYRGAMYSYLQLGFELGISGLLHAANAGGRNWGSGAIFGLGLRFTVNRLQGSIEDWVLGGGFSGSLGWQFQARRFSLSLYWQLGVLFNVSTEGGKVKDLPVIADRGPLRLGLPEIPLLNSSLIGTLLPQLYFTLSQALNVRISYYF